MANGATTRVRRPPAAEFNEFLNAIQRILHLFRFERALYLLGGSISFLVGIYAAIEVLRRGCDESAAATFRLLTGSAGFGFTAGGFLYMFNRVFNLFTELLKHSLTKKP